MQLEQDINSSKDPNTCRKKINSKIDHSFLLCRCILYPFFMDTFISIGSSEEAALSVGYAWRKVLVCNPDVHET